MKENPLKKLELLGQSIWLDYNGNDLFRDGKLTRLIEEDGVLGLTSNPSILEKAISAANIYDQDIYDLASQKKNPFQIYETILRREIQKAAAEFMWLYQKTNGKEGYVSLEINPHLAYDTNGTIEETRRIWQAIDMSNIFIKVPATEEGLPAIQQLISEGINVNATLIFGVPRYRQVIKAFMSGISSWIDQGKPNKNVASIAGFYLRRKDSVIDPIEEEFLALGGEQAHFAADMFGQVAISGAKVAYEIYKEAFQSEQFVKLMTEGARPQRLLWASTYDENPDSVDIKYVEALIGKDTINAMTPETLEAYRKHGKPAPRLESDMEHAHWVLSELTEVGINIEKIIRRLENQAINKYIKSFDNIIETITEKSKALLETNKF